MSDELSKQAFREEAYELLSELESSLLELEDDPGDEDHINRVFRALHTIKGSGSMFGFMEIAEFTHEAETVMDMVRNGVLAVNKELLDLTLAAKDHIQKMLDEDISPDPKDALPILEGFRRVAANRNEVAPDPEVEYEPEPEPIFEAGDESEPGMAEGVGPVEDEEPGHEERRPFLGLDMGDHDRGGGLYQIRVRPVDPLGGGGEEILRLLTLLSGLGGCRVVAQTGDLPELTEAEPDGVYMWWDVILSTTADGSDLEGMLGEFGQWFDIDLGKLEESVLDETDLDPDFIEKVLIERDDIRPEQLSEVLTGKKKLDSLLAEHGMVTRAQVESILQDGESPAEAPEPVRKSEPAPKAEPRPAAPSRTDRKAMDVPSSIRVAADKLDCLVDLVGELVIVQAQITQVVSERSDPVLTSLAEELERLSDELRDSTLGIRMLPIGTTFSKFRRLVRDLSSELGREIDLATQGAETELDKTVIERLSDPLVHLLRNSIDHGIESPDERRQAGKPPRGTILLSAEHSGGEVLIRIKDDGKGMDKEAIRTKAVDKGVIPADAELSDKDIFNLIFAPGFSTAKQVTSVSGRGVGMDVVKRAIDGLRGSIDISSVQGKGTTITIKLPLTLAIIDGLQILVGNEYYVIPLTLVEECVELTAEDVEKANGKQIINLRGEIVPYLRLGEWFDVPGDRPPIEQIVIVDANGERMGIVVDNVIGEHQTVIKSLGRIYRDVEGISGATIKGDGTMALILDMPRLVRSAALVGEGTNRPMA